MKKTIICILAALVVAGYFLVDYDALFWIGILFVIVGGVALSIILVLDEEENEKKKKAEQRRQEYLRAKDLSNNVDYLIDLVMFGEYNMD
jgi:Ca2+/Na+ antiporter